MGKVCIGHRHRLLLQSGALVRIGDHVGEWLSCKPLTFYVERHVYPQFSSVGRAKPS